MNSLRTVVPRIERVLRPCAYGIAAFAIYSVLAKGQQRVTYQNTESQTIHEAGVVSRSVEMLETFASLPMQAPAQALGQSIKKYDMALKSGDFSAAYALRLPAWKSIVSEATARGLFGSKVVRVQEIHTLAIEPLANLPGGKTPAYVVSRLALVDTPSKANQWFSYIETWVTDGESVGLAGGSPWDQPSLPVLDVNLK